MNAVVATVVEGHGEVKALPILLRRIALERYGSYVDVPTPFRLRLGQMEGDLLARAVTVVGERVGPDVGGVIVLRDADDEQPSAVEERLQHELDNLGRRRPSLAVVAVKEFEAWLLAALPSLRSHRSVRDDAYFEADPEAPRDAKGALSEQMLENYKPTLHQAAFVAQMHLALAEARCSSFTRLLTAVGTLLNP